MGQHHRKPLQLKEALLGCRIGGVCAQSISSTVAAGPLHEIQGRDGARISTNGALPASRDAASECCSTHQRRYPLITSADAYRP